MISLTRHAYTLWRSRVERFIPMTPIKPLPEISNNVGPVKLFFSLFERTSPFTPKSGLPCPSLSRCFDDHGSLIIFRSASVRPKHLFDPYFDHD